MKLLKSEKLIKIKVRVNIDLVSIDLNVRATHIQLPVVILINQMPPRTSYCSLSTKKVMDYKN